MPVQWAAALALAIAGPAAYLIWRGTLLWNYGALAVMPLFMLSGSRAAPSGDAAPPGGIPDGPWGPP
jgi:hypothetical protein